MIPMLDKYCKVCKDKDECEYGNAVWHACQHVNDVLDEIIGRR